MLNKFFPFVDFLYLLQLEEYDPKRYFKLIPRFIIKRNFQKRDKLVYTPRIKITLIIGIITYSMTLISLSFFLTIFIAFIFSTLLIPVWLGLANSLINIPSGHLKTYVQNRATLFVDKNFRGKVIAVAGSFGKTTIKNYIYQLIKFNYRTQMIPGNINTPTGIANWVLSNLEKSTEILIVEMDTYFIGEIKRSCAVTPPDIAVLTNVGDQHLERLGTKANLKKALEEVFKHAKPDAIKIQNKKTNLDYAIAVAKELKIPKDIIADTVKKLKKPDRRGDIKTMHGFTVIDESYNISETTVKFGLQNALLIAKKEKKKLIVITGGIPELGVENKDANFNYGRLLAKSNVEVILMKTILHKDVLKGLNKNILLAEGMIDAWKIIQEKYDPKKYIILMQPELGDQYY